MSDATKSPLETLIGPLEEFEYYADHQPAGDESPFERLYISLDVEDPQPDREYGLEIFFINDVTEAFGDQEVEEDAILAQFMLILPFRIRVDAYLEVMRYCNLVNRMLPIGAFGLSEQDEAAYLRYCLATESRAIPHDVLIEVVSAMEYACKAYAPQFEELSTGAKNTMPTSASLSRPASNSPPWVTLRCSSTREPARSGMLHYSIIYHTICSIG